MGEQTTTDGVIVAKFWSVGDWEGVYVDGELVEQNHQGRTEVADHIEGLTIETALCRRLNLPEDDYRYPTDFDDLLEDDRYDITEDDL